MPARPTLDDLRRFAVSRSLFAPTTLGAAIGRLGFVQADPIRAPARAQDLTLRHRVKDYVAGDLDRRYPRLDVHEDYFVNYGFLPSAVQSLMHPRTARRPWDAATQRRAQAVLEFVRERAEVHPREVDQHFAHGRVTNYWGGSSSATTHLLDGMHYRGLLRVVRRDAGVRVYAAHLHTDGAPDDAGVASRVDALVDVIVGKYAPLTASSLSRLIRHLRLGAPQWEAEFGAAIQRARSRLSHASVEGTDWFWPRGERPGSSRHEPSAEVRLLAPFDPVVWDRPRFELLWGWTYRFEAYTPAPRRKLGYYALPLLWRDAVIGWANVDAGADGMSHEIGFVAGRAPRERAFRRELDAELARLRAFLGR